jgi:exodeoxyribonuclease-5
MLTDPVQTDIQQPSCSQPHLDLLTGSQREAHDQLLNYSLRDTGHHAGLMVGYAGTGKTFTTARIVQSIQQLKERAVIAVAAPTHKAVRVLKRDAMKGVEYATIHSLLALKETYDDNGNITYQPDKHRQEPPPITKVDFLLLDEVSMLNSELYRMLLPHIGRGLKVIFIGDPAQIPPVNEKDSIPLLKWKELGLLKCELKEIMRQAEGNPILEFATEIRSNYKEGHFNPSRNLLPDGQGIETLLYDSPREEELLNTYFDSPRFREDADWMKVIAWRNAVVDNYNRKIRKIIYRNESYLAAVMHGEKLIMDRPVINDGRMILSTNEEVEVEDVVIINHEMKLKDTSGERVTIPLQVYRVRLSWLDNDVRRYYSGNIIHEHDLPKFNKVMEQMKAAAASALPGARSKMWIQYYRTRERFVWVKYNYAITGHKSQGSSYQHCLVLKWDIDYNRNIEERNRILYVACTRPRHTLFIEP